jgi:hypothetical protein
MTDTNKAFKVKHGLEATTATISKIVFSGDGSSATSISELIGPTGPTGPIGPQGFSSGRIYYFNYSITELGSYKQLGQNPTTATETIVTTSAVGNTSTLLSSFISNPFDFTFIPAGPQQFRIHASKQQENNDIDLYCTLRLADNTGSVISTIGSTALAPILWNIDANTPIEVLTDIVFPSTNVEIGQRIIVEIYALNNESSAKNVKFFTEGLANYSYVVTSLAAALNIPVITAAETTATSTGTGRLVTISDNAGRLAYYNTTASNWLYVGTDAIVYVNALTVEYLVVAGGGGGGQHNSGGGGAGGLLAGTTYLSYGTTSTITVGSGGTGGGAGTPKGDAAGLPGSNGNTSSIASIVVTLGGGGGGAYDASSPTSGGSGGGAGWITESGGAGTVGQGNDGGASTAGSAPYIGGGGGGAGAAGGSNGGGSGGNGGVGIASSISGSSTYYAGGGGAGGNLAHTVGGNGGGGDGSDTEGAENGNEKEEKKIQ